MRLHRPKRNSIWLIGQARGVCICGRVSMSFFVYMYVYMDIRIYYVCTWVYLYVIHFLLFLIFTHLYFLPFFHHLRFRRHR